MSLVRLDRGHISAQRRECRQGRHTHAGRGE
jgi:hypothetical protein